MFKKLTMFTMIAVVSVLPMFSQTDMEYVLIRHNGNKIVLIGEWRAGDIGKWREILSAEGIFEHGFTLLDRNAFSSQGSSSFGVRNLDAFEGWFRQRYALSATARWAVLDIKNELIVSGVEQPNSKEFDQMLEQRGVRSPLRKVRDFLRENPDHLDAKTDLLKEVRRRAIHVMPTNPTEDLDDETDLRTWLVLASEVDRVFSGNWLGIENQFFRQEEDQPERYSKLMRKAFEKHIGTVESALELSPANETLWNIWAWMARSIPEYKWNSFIGTFVKLSIFQNYLVSPSPEVCAWLVEEAMIAGDWDMVVNLAKQARRFTTRTAMAQKSDWHPGSGLISFVPRSWRDSKKIESYPIKSAYAPHLEALLRLGRIEEAHTIFDEMIRIEGSISTDDYKSDNALMAANAARKADMEDIAKIWERGELVNKVLYTKPLFQEPCFLVATERLAIDKGLFGDIQRLGVMLSPAVPTYPSVGFRDIDTLGWKKDDGEKWALLDGTGVMLAQGTDLPDRDDIQAIIKRTNMKSSREILQNYISENGSSLGVELHLIRAPRVIGSDEEREIVTRLFNKMLSEHPELMIVLPEIPFIFISETIDPNPAIKPLAQGMLAVIEPLLGRKPSDIGLWYQWIFWRDIEGDGRLLETLMEKIKYSPLTDDSGIPPSIMDKYLAECKANGDWGKAISLLEPVWEREHARISEPVDVAIVVKLPKSMLGDTIGINLIEAYLQANKPLDADKIFNAVIGFGSSFKNISKITELAKEKGYDRLAQEWESKVKK
ncbi:MAG: hypothetical protein FWG02_07345 [Holophagaceae bacterium]|nr:hypothetical protein [Holophagaceae bacterium]